MSIELQGMNEQKKEVFAEAKGDRLVVKSLKNCTRRFARALHAGHGKGLSCQGGKGRVIAPGGLASTTRHFL